MDETNVCAQTFGPKERVNLLHLAGVEDLGAQNLLVSLDVYAEAVFRTIYRDGRPISFDEVSPLDLARALIGLDVATGLLPPNVLLYGQGDGDLVAVYLPPERRVLRLHGEAEPLTVPTPPLVFVGRGSVYCVYALAAEEWPSAKTELYRAPFPNVYGGGRVCRGTVKFPPCGLDVIYQAAALFFDSDFNRDLGNGKSRKEPGDVTALWRALHAESAEGYPLDDLVAAGITMEELA